jgi:hypothetical protein
MLAGVSLTYSQRWLHAIDRTHQINGYLDYVDLEHHHPRLVTRGLDHSYTQEEADEPGWRHYQRSHQRPIEGLYDSDLGKTKITIFQSPHAYQRNSISMLFPCCNREVVQSKFIKRFSKTLEDKPLPPLPETILEPTPKPTLARRHSSPDLPHSSLTQPVSLIVSGDNQTRRSCIRHTRQPVRPTPHQSTSLRRAGLDADAYGWQKWDRNRQKLNDRKSQLKFFVGRERRPMSELVERRKLGEEIVGKQTRREDGMWVRRDRKEEKEPDEVVMFRSA